MTGQVAEAKEALARLLDGTDEAVYEALAGLEPEDYREVVGWAEDQLHDREQKIVKQTSEAMKPHEEALARLSDEADEALAVLERRRRALRAAGDQVMYGRMGMAPPTDRWR